MAIMVQVETICMVEASLEKHDSASIVHVSLFDALVFSRDAYERLRSLL